MATGGNGKVFISHSHDDNAHLEPLLTALASWGVDYWFDRDRMDAGSDLSARIQQAIEDRDIFIRVCSSAVQARPYWINLETNAFRVLQADDENAGHQGKRILVTLVLDRDYRLQPFERAALYIAAYTMPRAAWLAELRRTLQPGTSTPVEQVIPAPQSVPPAPERPSGNLSGGWNTESSQPLQVPGSSPYQSAVPAVVPPRQPRQDDQPDSAPMSPPRSAHPRRASLLAGVLVLALVTTGARLYLAHGSGSSRNHGANTTPGSTVAQKSTPLTACHATLANITEGTVGKATAPHNNDSGTYIIDGSIQLQPLVEQAAEEYNAANQTQITVTGGGSGTGLHDVDTGVVDIGDSDVSQAVEGINDLVDHQVAVEAFTLVVSPDLANSVQNLTTSQIQQIFSGQVTTWSQIGGPNEPITVVNRPTSSGARSTFDKYVLMGEKEISGDTLTQDSNGAVFAEVDAVNGSIGYVSTDFVTSSSAAPTASPICIDGFKADATDIDAGRYQFWNIEHMYTRGPATGFARNFLTYVESNAFQSHDVLALNFYQLKNIASSALSSHTESGAPAPESFYPAS